MELNKDLVLYTMEMEPFHMKGLSKMDYLMAWVKPTIKMEKQLRLTGYRELIKS